MWGAFSPKEKIAQLPVVYRRWKDEFDPEVVCEGFVMEKTMLMYGYARRIDPNGEIMEATYRNGVFHGLVRTLMHGRKVSLMLFREGTLQAQLMYEGCGEDF